MKTRGYASERVVLPTVDEGKRSLNNYEMVSKELAYRINRMQNSPKYQESINTREHLRPYQVVQRQADDAKEWFNSHTDFLKLMKLNRDCGFGVVGYAVPPSFDYMHLPTIKDKYTRKQFGVAAYTVYFKGFFNTVKEQSLFDDVLVYYGLRIGEILCTSFDRKPNGELTGRGYIKFRNSIVARLAIWELGEDPMSPSTTGQLIKCEGFGMRTCRVYMQPSNREMLLPLYPWGSVGDKADMSGINFGEMRWLPAGRRTLWHPRVYSEVDGLIMRDDFTETCMSDDPWLTVAGLDWSQWRRVKCLNCGEDGHIASDCYLESNAPNHRITENKGKGKGRN